MTAPIQRYYQKITPADGWAFVQSPTPERDEVMVFPVAAWAQTSHRGMVGLIALIENNTNSNTRGIVCSVVEPPSLPGLYKPVCELTPAELRALETGQPVQLPEPTEA